MPRNREVAIKGQALLKQHGELYMVEAEGFIKVKSIVLHQTGRISIKTHLSKTWTFWREEDLLLLATIKTLQGKCFFEGVEV